LAVYDFFCGAGGFSEGARQAGCRVAWCCDNDPTALKTHATNHPDVEHRLADLPLPRTEWPFPTDGRPFHAHFSPPCQTFSSANGGRSQHVSTRQRAHAEDLITWSLETALASGASSWTLEQVNTRAVQRLIEAVRQRHPKRVAWVHFDFAELGVPQKRRRILAGPPRLIYRLLDRCGQGRRRSVRDVVAVPRGTHIRNGWRGRGVHTKHGWLDNLFPIDGPAPTVLAGRCVNWVTRTQTGCEHPRMRTHETAALQTFPATYVWPDNLTLAQLQIGNAFPPLVARIILEDEAEACADAGK